ncbi:MAG TPA: peptidylprolyl isomerase [Gaiella sp.]|nr:peptidylprolyl isomerase [Gaiella sp.]
MPRAATIAALALVLVAAGCGGSSSSGGSTEATGGCEDVSAPAAREDGGGTAPTERLDPERTWTLQFDTSCGTFVVTLDLDSAPATAASLVSLAEAGYYDDTIFHRIVPGFVIQAGDPTQSGAGGPGYKTVDVPKTDAAYTKGVVAMAKTADEPAGTSGSQFFVVTGDDIGLPPEYAVVGTVTEGMDVVERIDQLGDPTTEQPLQPVVIHSVTASSS